MSCIFIFSFFVLVCDDALLDVPVGGRSLAQHHCTVLTQSPGACSRSRRLGSNFQTLWHVGKQGVAAINFGRLLLLPLVHHL